MRAMVAYTALVVAMVIGTLFDATRGAAIGLLIPTLVIGALNAGCACDL